MEFINWLPSEPVIKLMTGLASSAVILKKKASSFDLLNSDSNTVFH